MPAIRPEHYEFGSFRLIPRENRLLHNGRPVELTAKVFETLVALATHAGELVTKAALMEQVWPGTFVEESNLVQNISVLRRALAADPDGRDYIETVPKAGYRFTAAVKRVEPAAAAAPQAVAAPSSNASRRWLAAAMLAALMVLAASIWRASATRGRVTAGPGPVAVLGFRDLSGRTESHWLNRAIAEMLTAELRADGGLSTLSGEDVAEMRADLKLPDDAGFSKQTLGRILQAGAEYAVSGAFLPFDGKVRLDVMLQDARTGETILAVSRTAAENNLPELASQAGAEVRSRLGMQRLTEADAAAVRAASPGNAEARRKYALGLDRLRLFDAVAALPLLQEAVKADAGFPLAHEELSQVWTLLGYEDRARDEAKLALDRSGKLFEAERMEVEARYRSANGEWDKAIELYGKLWASAPKQVEFAVWLARTQTAAGKAVSAAATLAKARTGAGRDDPRVSVAAAEAAEARSDFPVAEREIGAAAEQARKQGGVLLEGRARAIQGAILVKTGKMEQARTAWQEAMTLCSTAGDDGCVAQALRGQAAQFFKDGDRARAREALERTIGIARRNGDRKLLGSSLYDMSFLDTAEGNLVAAKACLEEALAAARERHEERAVVIYLSRLAQLESRSGEAAEAAKRYKEGAELSKNVEGDHERAITLDDLGREQTEEGNLAEARKNLEEAVRLKRPSTSSVEYAYSVGLLAHVAYLEGDLAEARRLRAEQMAILDVAGKKSAAISCHLSMAAIDIADGKTQDAILAASKILAENSEKNPSMRANRILALAELAAGEPALADAAIRKSLALSAASTDLAQTIPVAIAAARVDAALGRTKEAAVRLQQAMEQAKTMGSAAFIFDIRWASAELAWISGDPTAAAQSASLAADAQKSGFGLTAADARRLSKARK